MLTVPGFGVVPRPNPGSSKEYPTEAAQWLVDRGYAVQSDEEPSDVVTEVQQGQNSAIPIDSTEEESSGRAEVRTDRNLASSPDSESPVSQYNAYAVQSGEMVSDVVAEAQKDQNLVPPSDSGSLFSDHQIGTPSSDSKIDASDDVSSSEPEPEPLEDWQRKALTFLDEQEPDEIAKIQGIGPATVTAVIAARPLDWIKVTSILSDRQLQSIKVWADE